MPQLYLYQSFFRPEDKEKIAYPTFTPWDNTENRHPWAREYFMWKNSTFKHKNEQDAYWGILSTKWSEKTGIDPKEFRQWIFDNPGFDLYYIDPFYFTPVMFSNTWVQGEQWHPGICEFFDRLFTGPTGDGSWYSLDHNHILTHFITANYYIGNSNFWARWMQFLDHHLYLATQDEYCFNFLYNKGGIYNGAWVPNFPFVTERLVTTFIFLNQDLKVLRWKE